MFDRHLIGDVAIAFLLAVPTIALSRPQPSAAEQQSANPPLVEKAAYANRTSVEKIAKVPKAALELRLVEPAPLP